MIFDNIDLVDLIDDFDKKHFLEEEIKLEKKRIEFVQKYSLNKIYDMKLDEYVSGLKKDGRENYKTFCYDIETGLLELGSMKGSSALKFGIYYSTDKKTYITTKKIESDNDLVFKNVKSEIYKLITSGATNDFNKINNTKLSPMFKYKILATYYPEKYICICSEPDVTDFLKIIGIKYNEKDTMIEKQQLLLNWKNQINELKNWSNYLLMRFLYDKIPIPRHQLNLNKNLQKEKDNNYPKKYKSKIKITKKTWIELLKAENIFTPSDLEILFTIYNSDNHANTSYNLGIIKGVPSESLSSQINCLSKRILNYLELNPENKKNGGKIYWNILFLGSNTQNNLFEWKIIPNLATAMDEVFPDLESDKLNKDLDNYLIDSTQNDYLFCEEKMEYNPEPKEIPEQYYINKTKVYKRNRAESILALYLANYKCEVDKNHLTFIRKNSFVAYTEPHHLIPMAYQDNFDVSLDVAANIVSLCSNCHNLIHYGKDSKELIELLYNKRKGQLEKAGIKVNIKELLSFYYINN